jgi:hypothetical protein
VTSSPEVSSPSAHVNPKSPLNPGLPHPIRCAFRVFHPRDALLLLGPTGPIPCRSAHGVFTLQSFPLPQSRDDFRRPVPSCRWLAPSPPNETGGSPGIWPKPNTRGELMVHGSERKALTRLQGLTPCGNPLRTAGGLAQTVARCSPGFSMLLRGFPPAALGSDPHRNLPPPLARRDFARPREGGR